MLNIENVLGLMVKDHLNIRNQLKECESRAEKNDPSFSEHFLKLKAKIEKHIAIEEKTIFSFFTDELPESQEIKKLFEEHSAIHKILQEIEESIINSEPISFARLKTILADHEINEEKILYRKFDSELNEIQKQKILDDIKSNFNF